MRYLKKESSKVKLSFILIDWSVRTSSHLIEYLDHQKVNDNDYEIIFIEFYSSISQYIKKNINLIDKWLILDMPKDSIYSKHFMYNIGIIESDGDVCIFCDPDSAVDDNFLQTILNHFSDHPKSVLHVDQFRSMNKKLYPFTYKPIRNILTDGFIKTYNSKTFGMNTNFDQIHLRNYGACMCANKEDLISIGGADEDEHYIGYICGPYEMSFRLVNLGRIITWTDESFMYHTWHPGEDQPHALKNPTDGRNFSSLALEKLINREVFPGKMNMAFKVKQKKQNKNLNIADIDFNKYSKEFDKNRLVKSKLQKKMSLFFGYNIKNQNNVFIAETFFSTYSQKIKFEKIITSSTEIQIKLKILLQLLPHFFFIIISSLIFSIPGVTRFTLVYLKKFLLKDTNAIQNI